MRPKCIVCNKPIRKKTTTWYVRAPVEAREVTYKEICGHRMVDLEALEAKPAGTVESTVGGSIKTVFVDEFPTTKDECSRLTNETVVSVSKHHSGQHIEKFSTWDGESYEDEFFDNGRCAQKQGYAAARHGHRFEWR
jgi:hypothetical protein